MNPQKRRTFLAGFSSLLVTAACSRQHSEVTEVHAAPATQPKTVRIVSFNSDGSKKGVENVEKIVKSKEEWRQQLSPEQYAVAREKGTERAFTGKYAKTHDKGIYKCVCCGTALFSSDTKFDSGTGWPSFWAPIAKENVATNTD